MNKDNDLTMTPKGFVTVREAAFRLKTSLSAVRREIRAGRLEAITTPSPFRGKPSHLYWIDVQSLPALAPIKQGASKRYPPSPSKPDSKAALVDALELFSRLQQLDPRDVAAQVTTKKGARDIHRDYWPVLAWLSYFFEELNAAKKSSQPKLGEGDGNT